MAETNTNTQEATKASVYGIKSIKFADTPTDGKFPTAWEGFKMKAIVKDGLSFNDSAPSTTNVEVEDMDVAYAILETDKGSRGFTIQTYDLSKEAYQFFYGYTQGAANTEHDGWLVESPGFVLTSKAVQVITQEFGEFPSRTFEWASMKLTVSNTGTSGKSGFPNLNIECKKQAFVNEKGEEIAGARWRNTPKEA